MANGLLSGLLGQDEDMTPEQQARNSALLMAGLQGLMASGPSLTPTSFGQILGQAGMTGIGAYNQSLEQAQANQMAQQMQQALSGGEGQPGGSGVADRYRQLAIQLSARDPQKANLYLQMADKLEGDKEKFTGNLANASLELFGTADISKLSEEQRRQAADYYRQQELARAQAGASRQTVNVEPGVQVGSIPPGYALVKGEDGSMFMQPIAGGPVERDIQEEAAKKEAGSVVTRTAAQTVFEDSDRAIQIVRNAPAAATGFGAAILQNIPATQAKELRGHIDSIKGNIGIDQLLKIKQSGAGLGQVPQTQLEMLASLLGNLDATQNQDVLLVNLQRVQEIYADIVRKEGGDPVQLWKERQERMRGGTPKGAQPLDQIFK